MKPMGTERAQAGGAPQGNVSQGASGLRSGRSEARQAEGQHPWDKHLRRWFNTAMLAKV